MLRGTPSQKSAWRSFVLAAGAVVPAPTARRMLLLLGAGWLLLGAGWLLFGPSQAWAGPVNVATSTSSQATAMSYQRKLFRDSSGYYWLFYFDGGNTRYERSNDTTGATWTMPSVLFANGQVQPHVWQDADTVYVAYTSNRDVLVRRGTISGGTISWSPTYVAMDGDASLVYSLATMCKDANGYLWVATRSLSGGTYSGCVARSVNPNDASAWLAPDCITPTSATGALYIDIQPLAGGDVYAVWHRDGAIEGKRYSAASGWEAATTSIAAGFTGDTQMLFSAVADAQGNVHLLYISPLGDVRYTRYEGTTWGAGQRIGDVVSGSPTITINPTDQRIYAIWADDRVCECWSAVMPSSSADWREEYGTPGKSRKSFITSCYSASGRVNWLYAQGGGSPYQIMTDGFAVGSLSVALSNAAFAFGTRPLDTWLAAQNTVITNDGLAQENIYGNLSQFVSGGFVWGISPTANGPDVCRAQWSTVSDAGPWNDVAAYGSEFLITATLAPGASVTFYFRIQTPTSTSSYLQYACTLTVRAAN